MEFSGTATFPKAEFHGPTSFFMVKFSQFADFAGARFRGEVNFTAIQGERGFSLANAVFDTAPNFGDAHFAEGPRLDDIEVLTWEVGDATSKYRELKRLAIQRHDHVREHLFFKHEMRSRLASKEDHWANRFVLRAYGGLSDFGSSFLRPLGAWIGIILVCTVVYWQSARTRACSYALGHSFYLSVNHGLVVLSGSKDQRIPDAYMCLYGEQYRVVATPPDPKLAPAKPTPAAIPGWITMMEILQSLLSVILLFLVALGVRNQFRIK